MSNVTHVDFASQQVISTPATIDLSKVTASRRVLSPEVISPATEQIELEVAADHAADPIKSLEDIDRITDFLVKNGRYRDNMLFIVGINFGLRISDLLTLRFAHLINEDFSFKDSFAIIEQKTRHTRKVERNRYITINDAVMDAVTLFLEHNPSRLDDFMFKSESNRSTGNTALSSYSVERILKKIGKDLGLTEHIATHTLRKTFGYHQMMMSGNSPRKLLLLQKMFGHSTSMMTLNYIGITNEEIGASYKSLNLGSPECYARFSRIGEAAQ